MTESTSLFLLFFLIDHKTPLEVVSSVTDIKVLSMYKYVTNIRMGIYIQVIMMSMYMYVYIHSGNTRSAILVQEA